MKKDIRKAGLLTMAVLLGAGTVWNTGMCLGKPMVVQAEENEQVKHLLDVQTTWKYLDDNTDPAQGLASLTAWTEQGFNDAGWKSAAGTFGAKRGQLNAIGSVTPTVLLTQYMEDGKTDIPAYFFRTTISVSEIPENAVVKGEIQFDDGAIVYLNGKEIASFGDITTRDTTTNLYYGGSNEGAGDPGKGTFTIDPEELKVGENVIAVEVHQATTSSSDIFFAMPSLTMEVEDTSTIAQSDVILTMGSDASSRNITWYTDSKKAGKVQVAKASAPEDYKEYEASTTAANDGNYTNQATITGLAANTEYVYRLVNADTVSENYKFKTGGSGEFSFALVGDPQIGASGNSTTDAQNWGITLDTVTSKLNPDFLLSAGDQVNTASSETEYDGYLNQVLASLASATSIGNHDSGSTAYGQHYNLPNESATLGTTTAGGDYWFVYNNTLFMGLNSNDMSTAEHKEFMKAAIAANPDVTWKTVFFHHSIYSTASHWDNTDIINRRNEYPAVFDELDIDVVLMGHDHVYTRSNLITASGNTNEGTESEVFNPEGILYLTANSASGSKYYNLQDGAIAAGYAAKYDQSKRRTVTDVNVTENSYTMTTYFADDMSTLDTYTIYKTDKSALEAAIEKANGLTETEYTEESWTALKDVVAAAQNVYDKEDVQQSEIDETVKALEDAMNALEEVKDEVTPGEGNEPGDEVTPGEGNEPGDEVTPDDGAASGDDKVSEDSKPVFEPAQNDNTPKTGDTTNVIAVALVMTAAGATTIALADKKRRRG